MLNKSLPRHQPPRPGIDSAGTVLKAVTSGDLVRYHHSHHGIVRGYAVMANRNTRIRG